MVIVVSLHQVLTENRTRRIKETVVLYLYKINWITYIWVLSQGRFLEDDFHSKYQPPSLMAILSENSCFVTKRSLHQQYFFHCLYHAQVYPSEFECKPNYGGLLPSSMLTWCLVYDHGYWSAAIIIALSAWLRSCNVIQWVIHFHRNIGPVCCLRRQCSPMTKVSL